MRTPLPSVAACVPNVRALPADAVPHPKLDEALGVAGVAGLELFDWQSDVLADASSVRADNVDRWAAREVAVIVSRQAGKGSILEVRQLAGLFVFGERLQIHSAHEFKTCYEHFRRVVSLVEGCDPLMREVKIIRTGAGDQAIELKNGNRIRFIARSRASGRGFSADTVYLDEAFHLSSETMGALMPALSARPNPQVWYTSSAPHATSDVLHSVRHRGLAGDDPRLYFAEWSNPADVDPADPEAWRRANPSLGLLVSEDDIAAEQRSLDPLEFARERLGIAEQPAATAQVIPSEMWRQGVSEWTFDGPFRMALDVSPDRKSATVGAAGRNAEGGYHVEVVHQEAGTQWIVDHLRSNRFVDEAGGVRVEKGGPAASWIDPLREAGVAVVEVATEELKRGTGMFIDAALSGELTHLDDSLLNRAVEGAKLRASGDAELWSRRSSSVDITPLVACSVALAGVPAAEKALPPLAAFYA